MLQKEVWLIIGDGFVVLGKMASYTGCTLLAILPNTTNIYFDLSLTSCKLSHLVKRILYQSSYSPSKMTTQCWLG